MDEETIVGDGSTSKERVVLVTGAGKGLGRAFAMRCAERGAAVVVNNRRRDGEADSASVTSEDIRSRGGRATSVSADVRDADAPARMVGAALEAFGALDALILNAGVSGPAARLEHQTPEAFQEVMSINLFANVAIVQAALPALRASGSGRILMIASSAGLYGVRGRAPYAASKAALIATALTLAIELRRDAIGVNVLAPYAMTNMTPSSGDEAFDRMMSPAAAAPMAVWLTSEACTASGQIWLAGGGRYARAQTLESPSRGPHHDVASDEDWIAAHLAELTDMTNASPYPHAEAAFQGFMSQTSSRKAQ